MPVPYCHVNTAEIYYEDYGEGQPILMIHGFSPDHRLMSGCMEPIFKEREGYRRIYIDLPGMGQSKNYERIDTTDDMLGAVLAFIDKTLPQASFLIAGESYGGYLARGIIAKRRAQVAGAAFICPMIIPRFEDRTVPHHTILQKDDAFLSSLSEEEAEDFASMGVVLNESTWNRYRKEILSGCRIADQRFLEKIKQHYEFTFELDGHEFDRPSVFLLGRQDASVGYRDAYGILERFPRATFAVLDLAGHNLQIEQPQLFHALINEWLDRVERF